jgi:hypothetical protein
VSRKFIIEFTKCVRFSKEIEAENIDEAREICRTLPESEFDMSHSFYDNDDVTVEEIEELENDLDR